MEYQEHQTDNETSFDESNEKEQITTSNELNLSYDYINNKNLEQFQSEHSGNSCNYLIVDEMYDEGSIYIGKSYKSTKERAVQHMISTVIAKDKFGLDLISKTKSGTYKCSETNKRLRNGRRLGVILLNKYIDDDLVSQSEAMTNFETKCKPKFNKSKELNNLKRVKEMMSEKVLKDLEKEVDKSDILWFDWNSIQQLSEKIPFLKGVKFVTPNKVQQFISYYEYGIKKEPNLDDDQIVQIFDYLKKKNLTDITVSVQHRYTIQRTILKDSRVKMTKDLLYNIKKKFGMKCGYYFT